MKENNAGNKTTKSAALCAAIKLTCQYITPEIEQQAKKKLDE